jgi:hypothetical protein
VDSLSGVSPVTKSTFKLVFLVCCFIALPAIALGQSIQSVYTDLDAKKCRTIKSTSDEGGSYEGRCPGVAGYTLIVNEGDVRQNIEVLTPRRNQYSLELWSVVSSAFSSVGPKAEWRMKRVKGKLTPFALIIRYNASSNPDDASKLTSYLVVAKITGASICITDKIGPGANANELARRAADESATKPCLPLP